MGFIFLLSISILLPQSVFTIQQSADGKIDSSAVKSPADESIEEIGEKGQQNGNGGDKGGGAQGNVAKPLSAAAVKT